MSKRMTLVIGTMCADGLLFCSDTEEGTLGGGKRAVTKLYDTGSYPNWHMVFGAAGFAPLCEVAAQRIKIAAMANRDTFGEAPEAIIREELKWVYETYIQDTLPDWKRLDRQISLLIAVYHRDKRATRLFTTYEEIVQPITQERFACIGSGSEIANYFLDRLFLSEVPRLPGRSDVPTIDEAERLLQFVMKEAKATVGGVGGYTQTFKVYHDAKQPLYQGTFGAGWEAKQPELAGVLLNFWLDGPKEPPKPSTSQTSEDQQ